jgi:hypothetical protein
MPFASFTSSALCNEYSVNNLKNFQLMISIAGSEVASYFIPRWQIACQNKTRCRFLGASASTSSKQFEDDNPVFLLLQHWLA